MECTRARAGELTSTQPKEPYVRPSLTSLGSLEEITQGPAPTGSKDGGIFGGNPIPRS